MVGINEGKVVKPTKNCLFCSFAKRRYFCYILKNFVKGSLLNLWLFIGIYRFTNEYTITELKFF